MSVADRICRSGAVDLICIDSVSALTPRAEIEVSYGAYVPFYLKIDDSLLKAWTSWGYFLHRVKLGCNKWVCKRGWWVKLCVKCRAMLPKLDAHLYFWIKLDTRYFLWKIFYFLPYLEANRLNKLNFLFVVNLSLIVPLFILILSPAILHFCLEPDRSVLWKSWSHKWWNCFEVLCICPAWDTTYWKDKICKY